MNVGVTVGMGIDVNCPDDDTVVESHREYLAVTEADDVMEDDLVSIDDTEDVAVCVCVFETCIEDVSVTV